MRAQRLDDIARTDGTDGTGIVRAVGGIQAQDMRAAMLGVAIRGARPQAGTAAIRSARERDRTIVRTWCMRGTLHLVPADLLPDLLAVFGPVYIPRGRRRLAALGLDDDASARGVAIIGDVLAGRAPQTRHEIAAAVGRRDHTLDLRGQAPIHLLRRACLAGVVCEVGSRDRQPVYGLRRDWFPDPAPQRSDALGILGRWYIDAFGPASRDDFAAWSGLPAADVRQAWDQIDGLVEVHADLWIRGPDPGAPAPTDPPTVRLVPAFDSYLLGYRRRDHAVAPEHRTRVHPGGGVIRSTVLVDGLVAGTWTIQRSATKARLVIATFSGVPGVPMSALDAEAARVSAALEVDLTLAMVG